MMKYWAIRAAALLAAAGFLGIMACSQPSAPDPAGSTAAPVACMTCGYGTYLNTGNDSSGNPLNECDLGSAPAGSTTSTPPAGPSAPPPSH